MYFRYLLTTSSIVSSRYLIAAEQTVSGVLNAQRESITIIS